VGKVRINWSTISWAAIFFLFLVGGLGLYIHNVRLLGALVPVVGLGFLLFSRRRIALPRGFLPFFAVLVILGINTTWSKGRVATLEYLVMLSGGGAFWLVFYNLGEKFKDTFGRLVIILGIVFGVSYLVNLLVFPQVPIRPWTLYLPSTFSRNHNHLGDMWALVLVVVAHRLLTRPKLWHWGLVAAGVYFLGISLSRSAYLALGVGIFYIFNKLELTGKHRKIYALFLIVAAGLFMYAALFKSTLLSRPYYEQAVYGLSKWPLGVGVGNFGIISGDSQAPWWNAPRAAIVTTSAHNLVLEMISGMGVLGLVFAFWLVYILVDILRNSKQPLFAAIFLAIAANFMFDTTYFIPTMVWLWFASLGLAQTGSQKKEKLQKVQL